MSIFIATVQCIDHLHNICSVYLFNHLGGFDDIHDFVTEVTALFRHLTGNLSSKSKWLTVATGKQFATKTNDIFRIDWGPHTVCRYSMGSSIETIIFPRFPI